MSAVTLKVNGRTHTLDLDPSTPLLYALSDDLELRAYSGDVNNGFRSDVNKDRSAATPALA